MNLYIDIGNTNITFYEDNNKQNIYKIKSKNNKKLDEKLEEIFRKKNYDLVFISSVVPELNQKIKEFFTNAKEIILLESDIFPKLMNFGNSLYEEMGADRVVVDYASVKEYGKNLIILDLGTAITVDVIKDEELINGHIFPGLELIKSSIVEGASLLSNFHLTQINESNENLNTFLQLNSGLIYGILGVLKMYININKKHFPLKNHKTIITGGGSINLISKIGIRNFLDIIDEDVIIDDQLMYKGLKKISQICKE